MPESYRDILAAELLSRKRSNHKFSLRAFARFLGVSPGHLSSLIHGKRNLTRQQATKIISRLELSPGDRRAFLASAFPEFIEVENPREQRRRLLRDDEFNLISDWHHFAILSLGEIAGNRAEPAWVAQRLGITNLQARDALNRIKRLGLVTIYKDGSFRQTSQRLTTNDDVPSQAIRSFHRQNLDLAKLKLDTVAVESREYGAVTMAINPAKLSKAKQLIREFQNRLSDELEVGRRKAVYTLAIQLFPLSQNQDER